MYTDAFPNNMTSENFEITTEFVYSESYKQSILLELLPPLGNIVPSNE